MISRTKVKSRISRKSNPMVAATVLAATKNKSWFKLAHLLSGSTKKYASVNLSEIDRNTSAGDTIIVPGKVLSSGDITKKVRICSLSISKSALDKLKKSKSEYVHLIEEIKINPKAQGLKIIQ